jgi:hypothetical protein
LRKLEERPIDGKHGRKQGLHGELGFGATMVGASCVPEKEKEGATVGGVENLGKELRMPSPAGTRSFSSSIDGASSSTKTAMAFCSVDTGREKERKKRAREKENESATGRKRRARQLVDSIVERWRRPGEIDPSSSSGYHDGSMNRR